MDDDGVIVFNSRIKRKHQLCVVIVVAAHVCPRNTFRTTELKVLCVFISRMQLIPRFRDSDDDVFACSTYSRMMAVV